MQKARNLYTRKHETHGHDQSEHAHGANACYQHTHAHKTAKPNTDTRSNLIGDAQLVFFDEHEAMARSGNLAKQKSKCYIRARQMHIRIRAITKYNGDYTHCANLGYDKD